MNPLIVKQLEKCRVAAIPHYEEDTLILHINKTSAQNEQTCVPGKCYLLQLEDYLLAPPVPNFNLHINWNKGIVPTYRHYKAEILQIMGSMVKINGVGYDWDNRLDTNTLWSGWLPLKGIKIVEEI